MNGGHGDAVIPGGDHERFGPDVAGYVLGGLTPDEQRAFEAHLAVCSTCQAELAELDPLPVLLDLARPAPDRAALPIVAPAPEPPAMPAPVVVPMPAGRAPRGRRLLVAAAMVVVALLLGGAIGAGVTRTDGPRFSTPVALQAVGDAAGASPVPAGSASWRSVDSGTLVRLDLTGLPGDGTYYECLWISGQGAQSAGTFRPDSDGNVHVDLTTAATKYPGWRLEIRAHPSGDAGGDGVTVLDAQA